jgi:molybdopterin converting factor subunit 1
MNKIRLLFFATLRDRAGTRAAEIDVPVGTTVSELKDRIGQDYPNLKPYIETALIAVNREYAQADVVLAEGAEVALFPPVSGGQTPGRF